MALSFAEEAASRSPRSTVSEAADGALDAEEPPTRGAAHWPHARSSMSLGDPSLSDGGCYGTQARAADASAWVREMW